MLKKILGFLFLLFGLVSNAQNCPIISFPVNGTVDIPVDATIRWSSVVGINGYLISMGTTQGGTDILSGESVGNDNFYKAPLGLPANTQIYVTISILLSTAPLPQECASVTFTTVDVTAPPPCTILVAPDDNAANVTIVTDIIWAYAPTATGYRLSMGTTTGGTDILNNQDMGNVLSYEPPEDLPQDTLIFVTVIPFNDYGSMTPCTEESFKTGPAPFVCDSYVDEQTGETIYRRPQIEFPDLVGLCSDELPYIIRSDDTADGFRWFKANVGNEETLISESQEAAVNEPGRYRYEAYNLRLLSNGNYTECVSSQLFTIVTSQIAQIEKVDVVYQNGTKTITVFANGSGEYEYALDNREGPYQELPVFENIAYSPEKVYVRDKNGCGITERTVDRDLTLQDFPKFFTPNGDGVNDFWQYVAPPENFELSLERISIFDRYGSLLVQIDPKSRGWNGIFNGKALPSSDYWFRATYIDEREIIGHFALKR